MTTDQHTPSQDSEAGGWLDGNDATTNERRAYFAWRERRGVRSPRGLTAFVAGQRSLREPYEALVEQERAKFRAETLRVSALMRAVKAMRFSPNLWLLYAIDRLDTEPTDNVLARVVEIIDFERGLGSAEQNALSALFARIYEESSPTGIDALTVDAARAALESLGGRS